MRKFLMISTAILSLVCLIAFCLSVFAHHMGYAGLYFGYTVINFIIFMIMWLFIRE
jgi:uncharacterized membrane protein